MLWCAFRCQVLKKLWKDHKWKFSIYKIFEVSDYFRSPAGQASWWCPAAVWPEWPQLGKHPPQRPGSSRKREPGNTSASGFSSLHRCPGSDKAPQPSPLGVFMRIQNKRESHQQQTKLTKMRQLSLNNVIKIINVIPCHHNCLYIVHGCTTEKKL